MSDLFEHNLEEIYRLQQRGGRMLSVVDLIEDGTLDEEMAGYLLCTIARGASFLTSAKHGGVGKTTLLADLLAFLPPEVRIETLSNSRLITQAHETSFRGPRCFLAHEIGSGPWFGYIWGEDVPRFMRLRDEQHYVTSCIHADTMEELRSTMLGVLGAEEDDIARLDLILFMRMDMRGRRRVVTFYEAAARGEGKHELLYEWNSRADAFERKKEPSLLRSLPPRERGTPELEECVSFIRELVAAGEREFGAVRRRVIKFLSV